MAPGFGALTVLSGVHPCSIARLAVGGRLCMCLPLRPTPSLRGYESKAHGLRRLLGAATRTVAATPCPCLKKNCFSFFCFSSDWTCLRSDTRKNERKGARRGGRCE